MMKLRAGPLQALLLTGVALCGCASAPGSAELALAAGKPVPAANELAMPSDLEGAIRRAQTQRMSGDLNGATHTLSQLILIAPDDPRVLGEYGKTLIAKGDASDALAFLGQAITFQPNDWTLHSAQGVAYDQRGNYVAAQEAYNRALALKPGEPGVLSNAGLSRMQAGDLAGAEALLRAAAQNGADNTRITRNLALLQKLKTSKAAANTPSPSTTTPAQTAIPTPSKEQKSVIATATSAPTKIRLSPPGPPTGIAALATDPTVVMGPIPHDDFDAKPRKPKPATPAVIRVPAMEAAQKVATEARAPKLRPAQ